MNIVGAVLLLVGTAAAAVGIWIALEQRLSLRTRVRQRFSLLSDKPWLFIGIMAAAVLLIGLFLLMFRVPVAVYYTIGGLLTGSAIMLLSANDKD